MGFKIQPSKVGAGPAAPEVFPLTPESSQTFEKGTPITVTAGEAVEHALGATVTNIYGFSLEGVTSGVSDNPSGDVHVAKANRITEFVAQCITSGAVATDLSGVAIGDQYGLLKSGTDFYVDLDDEVHVVVQITKIDDNLNVVWFAVLESALQEP
jgi:hypothetical protein